MSERGDGWESSGSLRDAADAGRRGIASASMKLGLEVDPRSGHTGTAARHQIRWAHPLDATAGVRRRVHHRPPTATAHACRFDGLGGCRESVVFSINVARRFILDFA
ncbi:MAG: hypothetical protein U1E32_01395, partial [Rhodoglobus sp.]|nr:hypothetical protein [Rhodoglobus sp.]